MTNIQYDPVATLKEEAEWEVRVMGQRDLVKYSAEEPWVKAGIEEARAWLLGGKTGQWKVQRDLSGILLMRK